MKLGRVAMVVLAVVTMGIAVGGAAATWVVPGPGITSGPRVMVLNYVVGPIVPGAPVTFSPFVSTAPHSGLVQVHLANQDGSQHAYLLQGNGMLVSAPPYGGVTMLAFLNHPGMYAWINVVPYPGVPFGATVGILNVS